MTSGTSGQSAMAPITPMQLCLPYLAWQHPNRQGMLPRQVGQAALLNAVERIGAARSARLVLMGAPNDSPRWVAVLLLAVLTQVSVAVAHLDRARSQIVALSLSTAAAIIALAPVAILEHPFDGANQISLEPLRQAVAAE